MKQAMYRSYDVASAAEISAEKNVMLERSQYIAFYTAIEEYAYASNLIISGSMATKLLLKDDPFNKITPDIDFQVYEIYTDDAAQHATELSNRLYLKDPDGLGKITKMYTMIPGVLFGIEVNCRLIAKVVSFPRFKGQTTDAVIPSLCAAFFAKNKGQPLIVKTMGPEIQLLMIYKKLMSPASAGDWVDLLVYEQALRKELARTLESKFENIENKIGGDGDSDNSDDSDDNDSDNSDDNIIDDSSYDINVIEGRNTRHPLYHHKGSATDESTRKKVYSMILGNYTSTYFTRPDVIMVGPAAIKCANGESITQNDRLQALIVVDADSEASSSMDQRDSPLYRHGVHVASIIKGVKTQWNIANPRIPTDPHVQRLTVKYFDTSNEKFVAFMDIFAVNQYELIPFMYAELHPHPWETSDGAIAQRVKIGTPIVLMRMRLVDIWTMQFLHTVGMADTAYSKQILKVMLKDYMDAAGLFGSAMQSKQYDTVFPSSADMYTGVYEDEATSEKRAKFADKKKSGFQKSYYPYVRAQRDKDPEGEGLVPGSP